TRDQIVYGGVARCTGSDREEQRRSVEVPSRRLSVLYRVDRAGRGSRDAMSGRRDIWQGRVAVRQAVTIRNRLLPPGSGLGFDRRDDAEDQLDRLDSAHGGSRSTGRDRTSPTRWMRQSFPPAGQTIRRSRATSSLTIGASCKASQSSTSPDP